MLTKSLSRDRTESNKTLATFFYLLAVTHNVVHVDSHTVGTQVFVCTEKGLVDASVLLKCRIQPDVVRAYLLISIELQTSTFIHTSFISNMALLAV